MKKVILSSYGICVILSAVLLYGCSKDKDEDTPSKRILGLWNVVREAEITKNKNTGIYSDTAFNDPIPLGIVTGEFRDNGKFYFNIYDSSPSKDTIDYHFHNESTLFMDSEYYYLSDFTNKHLTTTNFYFDGSDSIKHILEFIK
jgi:hypothetical protein